MSTKRLIVQVTEEQLAWLDARVQPLESRAAVVRALIDRAREEVVAQTDNLDPRPLV
jgi:hypothetical protein